MQTIIIFMVACNIFAQMRVVRVMMNISIRQQAIQMLTNHMMPKHLDSQSP